MDNTSLKSQKNTKTQPFQKTYFGKLASGECIKEMEKTATLLPPSWKLNIDTICMQRRCVCMCMTIGC